MAELPINLEQLFLRSSPSFLCRILSRFNLDVLVRLGRLNRLFRYVVVYYFKTTWNVKTFLHRWFRDPQMFLSLLRKTLSLVTGSQVVAFFDRGPIGLEPLDIVVPKREVARVALFLCEEGYILQCGHGGCIRHRNYTMLKMTHDKDIVSLSMVRLIIVCGDPISYVMRLKTSKNFQW
jgi:hypothetical protein